MKTDYLPDSKLARLVLRLESVERGLSDLSHKLAREYHNVYVEDTAHGILEKKVRELSERVAFLENTKHG